MHWFGWAARSAWRKLYWGEPELHPPALLQLELSAMRCQEPMSKLYQPCPAAPAAEPRVHVPGGMYNRAFLRAYSEFLGLDPQSLVSRYDAETMPAADKKVPRPRVPVPQHSSERRVHPLAAWIVMLAASTAGVFFSRHWIAQVFSPYFSRSPAAQIHPPVAAPETKAVQERPAPAPPPSVQSATTSTSGQR